MKVSFFALPIYYDSKGGGGFVHTMEISANLSQLVQHVSIFMRSLKLHGFRSLEISPRLNVCETRFAFATSYLGFETLVSIPSTYESMLLVDNIMKKECFDVMINRFCPLNPWGTYLSKKYGLPLVLEVHSIPTTEKYKALLINRMIAQLKQSRLIITQTRLLKTQISKYTKKPIIVIPNGVNTNLFNPSNNSSRKASLGLEGKRIVAFSGSFAMWKGTDLILRIAREVVNAHPNVRFMVIGGTPKGVLDEFIWNKPKNLYLGDLKPLICFTGWVPYMNVPKFLAIADLCIHTAQSLNPIKLLNICLWKSLL